MDELQFLLEISNCWIGSKNLIEHVVMISDWSSFKTLLLKAFWNWSNHAFLIVKSRVAKGFSIWWGSFSFRVISKLVLAKRGTI